MQDMGAASQNEANKRQHNTFDLNVLPHEEEGHGPSNLSQMHHVSGKKLHCGMMVMILI